MDGLSCVFIQGRERERERERERGREKIYNAGKRHLVDVMRCGVTPGEKES